MKKLIVFMTLILAACSPKADKAPTPDTQDAAATAPSADEAGAHDEHGHDDHGHDHGAHGDTDDHAGMDHGSLPAGEVPGTSIYNLETEWTTEAGETVQLKDFEGKPVVLLMFYATCQSACPTLILDLKAIDQKLSEEASEETQFVLVSFDPETDTVENLKKLKKAYDMEDDRYTLLHGTSGEVRELAAVLGVQYRERSDGHFTHSNLLTLLDRTGVVDARVEGLSQPADAIISSVEKMVKEGK